MSDPSPSALELLNMIMTGHEMTPEELNLFLSIREGLYLDYKDGNKLHETKNSGTQLIREYLTAFANSDGGILVVGVSDEQPRQITGAITPTKRPLDLAEWAADAIKDIHGFFSPPPRFQVVDHPDGAVLIAATLRSPRLVPCPREGKLRYYIRLHDKTLEAEEYLLADLHLGRRQRPDFAISSASVS